MRATDIDIEVSTHRHTSNTVEYLLKAGNIELLISILPTNESGAPIRMYWGARNELGTKDQLLYGVDAIAVQIAILERAYRLLVYGI